MTFVQEKEKVNPIYGELLGYLEHAPTDEYYVFSDKEIWEQINREIDVLNQITGKDYNKYKVSPGNDLNIVGVWVYAYKSKLGSLISSLYREYFADYGEPAPFSKNAGTVIHNQNSQHQSQQQYVTVTLFEMQDKIDKLLPNTKDEKVRAFLIKLKEHLRTITSVFELIKMILMSANENGLDIHTANHTINTLLS